MDNPPGALFSFGFGNWWHRLLNILRFNRHSVTQSKKAAQEYQLALEAVMVSASPLSRAMGHWMGSNSKIFGRQNSKSTKSRRSFSRGAGIHTKTNREIIVLSICNPVSDDAVFIDHIGSKFDSIRYIRVGAGTDTGSATTSAKAGTKNEIELIRNATRKHSCALVLNEIYISLESEKLVETVRGQVDCNFDLVLLGPGCFGGDDEDAYTCTDSDDNAAADTADIKKEKEAEFEFSPEQWLLEARELCKPQGCVLFCCKNLTCSPNTLGEGIEAADILRKTIKRNQEMRQRVQSKLTELKIKFRVHPIESWLDIAEGVKGTAAGLAFLDKCFDTKEAFTNAEAKHPGSTKKLREKLESSATRACLRTMSTEEIVKPIEQANSIEDNNNNGGLEKSSTSLFIRIQGEIFHLYNDLNWDKNEYIEDELSIMNTDKALIANRNVKTEWDGKCWPEGPDGKFHNFGYENWLEGRRDWLKVEQTNTPKTERPPLAYEEIIEGLMNNQRHYELPHPVHLPDIIDIFTDIWDAQDSF